MQTAAPAPSPRLPRVAGVIAEALLAVGTPGAMAALALGLFAALAAPGDAFAKSVIAAENAATPTTRWLYSEARAREIEGYSSAVSVEPRESIGFHLSAVPAAAVAIEVYRLGWYGGSGGTLKACLPFCGGTYDVSPQAVPPPISPTDEVRANWPQTSSLVVPSDWVSGYYVANAVILSGETAGLADQIPFVVRANAERRAQILAQVPVNTWQAYNGWGEKSLYPFNSSAGKRANRVSFDRPYFIGAGQQEMSRWELDGVAWLERDGYDVAYQTDVDTHRRPRSLLEHRLVVTLGHGEYWTREMRNAFESARDLGTNLAFMGANTAYWQVRYENNERTIVGYKSLYDPEPNIELKTALFREVGRPECALLGVQHQGGPQNWPNADYTVAETASTDPWFADTGLVPGDVIPGIVSIERDSVPDSGCGNPTVLFRYRAGGDTAGDAEAVKYTAASGARVFSTGSFDFVAGLAHARINGYAPSLVDERLQRFMRNAMADLLRPAPPRAVVISVRRGRVTIRVDRANDPRTRLQVFRGSGTEGASPPDPGWRLVCDTRGTVCAERPLRTGTYRYAARVIDQWSASTPALGAVVRVVVSGRGRR